MSTVQIDTERSEAFAEELTRGLNGAATTLMVSIGHRTGLFDALSDAGATDERSAGRTSRAPGALRARMAWCDDGRSHRPARPRQRDVSAPARARSVADARRLAEQHRGDRAMDLGARPGRGRHRAQLPRGRRCALRAVPPLPRDNGRGERPDDTRRALRPHPPARPRTSRAPRGRDPSGRSRVWTGQGDPRACRSGSRTARSSASTSATMPSSGRAPGRPSSDSTT